MASTGTGVGSSPLTRGKRKHAPLSIIPSGLIPAHAGKTFSTPRRTTGERAHPRSRGENIVVSAPIIIRQGSSPLTRGKRGAVEKVGWAIGLIPAHAGKTRKPARRRWSRRAHPRSRGENTDLLSISGGPWGSSPLTRGKRGCGGSELLSFRLIPAHAGKTDAVHEVTDDRGAHPRSRGENEGACLEVIHGRGSSPLTRGKPR